MEGGVLKTGKRSRPERIASQAVRSVWQAEWNWSRPQACRCTSRRAVEATTEIPGRGLAQPSRPHRWQTSSRCGVGRQVTKDCVAEKGAFGNNIVRWGKEWRKDQLPLELRGVRRLADSGSECGQGCFNDFGFNADAREPGFQRRGSRRATNPREVPLCGSTRLRARAPRLLLQDKSSRPCAATAPKPRRIAPVESSAGPLQPTRARSRDR